jgi:hypothetical protein
MTATLNITDLMKACAGEHIYAEILHALPGGFSRRCYLEYVVNRKQAIKLNEANSRAGMYKPGDLCCRFFTLEDVLVAAKAYCEKEGIDLLVDYLDPEKVYFDRTAKAV